MSEARTVRTRTEQVQVELGPRAYPVVVGSGLVDEVGPRLVELGFT